MSYDLIFRLKPQVGDTAPHDETGNYGTLAGTAFSLVSDGAGGYAWRVTDVLNLTGFSRTYNGNVTGDGFMIAWKLKVGTGGAANYMGVRNSGDPVSSRAQVEGVDAATLRANFHAAFPLASLTHGSGFITLVARYHADATAGLDEWSFWWSGGGGTDAPDGETIATISGTTANQVYFGAASRVLDVAACVLTNNEPTDAECRAIAANGINETLDGGGSTSAQFAADLPILAWSGAATMPALAAFLATLPPLAWAGGVQASGGTLTSRQFHSGAVLPLASGSIPYVLVANLDLTNATRYTAQSYNASGLWSRTDAAFVSGQSYLVLYSDGAGTFGAEVLQAV